MLPRLVNRTTGQIVAARAFVARSLWAQMIGWIGQRPDAEQALGLPGCAAVHTAGMRWALDIAFCDPAGRVLQINAAVPPWRIAAARRQAAITWETRAGVLASRARPGDVLVLETG
jgi:hypothetical protein